MKKYKFYSVIFLKDNILQRRFYKDSTKFYEFVEHLLSSGYEVQISIKNLFIDEFKF